MSNRVSRRSFLLGLGAVALAAGCGDRSGREILGDADMPVLERQGGAIRAALERYREANDAYPASLAEAGLTGAAVETRFGPWRYARSGAGLEGNCEASYGLAVGDYDEHHFQLHWDCRRGRWYWNR